MTKEKTRMKRKLTHLLMTDDPNILKNEDNFSFIVKSLNRLKRVNIGMKYYALNILCRCFRKHKGYGSVQRLVNF